MKEVLERILNDKSQRKELINEFQTRIWNDGTSDEVLSELAFDLDFYEPNEILRNEDGSNYGDQKLEELIRAALKRLSG